MPAKDAAEQLAKEGHKVSWRSIYEWQKKVRTGGKAGAALSPPTGSTVTITGDAPGDPPPPMARAELPPEGLSAQARALWYVEREIRACSDAIAQAHAKGGGDRTASLQDQLRKWLRDLNELSPPAPPDAHAEERRWRSAADSVIAKIRAGIRVERERA